MKRKPANNFLFSDEELDQFKREYPTTTNIELGIKYGLTPNQVWKLAKKNRLAKYNKAKVPKKLTEEEKVIKNVKARVRAREKKFTPMRHTPVVKFHEDAPKWLIEETKRYIKRMNQKQC